MKKILNVLIKFVKAVILRDPFALAARKWFADKGDQALRLNYTLGPDSLVFDVGGYHGDFADAIHKRYGCKIYIFEPVPNFYEKICERFQGNEKIKIFPFGLSDADQELEIALSENASSVHIVTGETEKIQLKSIQGFIDENHIKSIDLMKVNIEGGEFELVPQLLRSGQIRSIKNLQVQFHKFIEDAEKKRETIRAGLKRTHHLTYDYYFIWENWELT